MVCKMAEGWILSNPLSGRVHTSWNYYYVNKLSAPSPCPARANSTNAMSQPWSLRAFFIGDEVIDVTPERKKADGLYIDVF